MDMGGSAQNTLYSCAGLAGKYRIELLHGPSLESGMTTEERSVVETRMGEARRRGVRVGVLSSLVRRIDPILDLKTFISLLAHFHREKPEIVHTHSSKAGLLGRWAGWLARVPHIIHTPHGHVFSGHFDKHASAFFFWLEKITDLITDRTIALTKGEKDDYLKLLLTRDKKLEIVHSGVNIEAFENSAPDISRKKESVNIEAGSPVVGFVGWLLPIKGPDILLKAMEKVWIDHPDATLVYVGKGESENILKFHANETGVLPKVKFLGWRQDIPEIMRLFDVFVLPSRNEGMGRVLVEAMATGLPVIGSRVGGIPDLIRDGYNGFLFEAEHPDNLAYAISRLLADKKLRTSMGKRGRNMAKDYSIEAMVQKIDRLYSRIL